MKLSDYVFEFIAKQGTKHVFVVPGGGCMHLVDSLGKTKDLTPVSCLHEQACAFAAEAYAEFDQKLGVALVTTGPGGTNAITGVAAAWIESASTLTISGQVKTKDLLSHYNVRSMGQQEVDIISMVKPITKYAVLVKDPSSIRYHLEKAVYLATHGRRGPVWLDIPLDVQAAEIDPARQVGFTAEEPLASKQELQAQVAQVVRLLSESKKPALLVGNGVRTAGGMELLRQVIARAEIPVLVTWKMIDFIGDDHPLYAGRPGGIGQRYANFVQQNADCLIAVGARLDLPSIAFEKSGFAKRAKRVLVDVDPGEVMKLQDVLDVPVCADAKAFLAELLEQLPPSLKRPEWVKRVHAWREKYPVVLDEYRKATNYASSYVLVDTFSDLVSPEELIVPGSSGSCSDVLMQAFRVKQGQRVLNAPGLGAMGTGIPATIGACLASGGRRTICMNGDGGFQFNVQELETIRRLDLPIKFFVLNNGGYRSIVASQKNHFGRLVAANPQSGLTLPDVKQQAAVYGMKAIHIANNSELKSKIQLALDTKGPVICEVMIDPDEVLAPRVASRLVDGKMVTNAMEDMSPPLPRDELEANMRD